MKSPNTLTAYVIGVLIVWSESSRLGTSAMAALSAIPFLMFSLVFCWAGHRVYT